MNVRRVRCWAFADCVFDEANWLLTVAGRRVAIESKPLELLRELLLHAGNLVSKAELLDAIWPDTAVVEASLTTAIHKLRVALNDDKRDSTIIETVPRIGYRLTVPVEVTESDGAPRSTVTVVTPAKIESPPQVAVAMAIAERAAPPDRLRLLMIGGVLAIASVLVVIALGPSQKLAAETAAKPVAAVAQKTAYLRQRDASIALRKMDVAKVEQMLAAGWDPSTPFDQDRNGALNILLGNCEWDKGHDQRKMLLLARTLIDGGEELDRRNAWGDTPYSIAKAERYCGPRHPVTKMMKALCYAGPLAPGDRCLADYINSDRPQIPG